MHYMSVNHWGAPGRWYTNYAGIAYSDDNGQNWTKDANTRWQNTTNWDNKFQMAAFVRNSGYVYMFATPNGRFDHAYLARVPENSLLNKSAYQYWDGTTWRTNNEATAVPIVAGPVAELSVQYNSYFKKWLMLYLNENRSAIVLREAPSLTGPWSAERIVVQGAEYPQLYGGFIHPWTNNDQDLYFLMSQWQPYNVYLMRTRLSDSAGDNIVSDGGFEEHSGSSVAAPWTLGGTGGIYRGAGTAHDSANNGWLRSTSGWNNLYQTIAVAPNRNYRLTGWIRTASGNTDGYFGVRTPQGTVIKEQKFGSLGGYTLLTVDFNSGSNTLVEVFTGMWGNGSNPWVQIDDIAVVDRDRMQDGSFEQQTGNTIQAPWAGEGNGDKGIDRNAGFARTGLNNAWIRTASTGWNAITQQVAVKPNTAYQLTGWVKTSNNYTEGYVGARPQNSSTPLAETKFGQFADPNTFNKLTVNFNSGTNTSVTVFLGYWGPGQDSWVQVDDLALTQQ